MQYTCGPYPMLSTSTATTAGGAPCVFPFTYQGEEQQFCSNIGRSDYWCVTDPAAYASDPATGWATCDVSEGSSSKITSDGNMCQFPFDYKGVTYNRCTSVDTSGSDGGQRYWCVTNSTTGDWGYCDSSSILETSKVQFQTVEIGVCPNTLPGVEACKMMAAANFAADKEVTSESSTSAPAGCYISGTDVRYNEPPSFNTHGVDCGTDGSICLCTV